MFWVTQSTEIIQIKTTLIQSSCLYNYTQTLYKFVRTILLKFEPNIPKQYPQVQIFPMSETELDEQLFVGDMLFTNNSSIKNEITQSCLKNIFYEFKYFKESGTNMRPQHIGNRYIFQWASLLQKSWISGNFFQIISDEMLLNISQIILMKNRIIRECYGFLQFSQYK
ncbi:Hypothetical_protein [Hexamita inflata]|uniref:Hypothetical_protein n=1 Tax=Hexamita inflata TaxID=28002 RepID=A0AA86NCT9_9EUKA|nr:Hypothetical protein HINF_LOCUS4765 [Hexamita inflata]